MARFDTSPHSLSPQSPLLPPLSQAPLLVAFYVCVRRLLVAHYTGLVPSALSEFDF